MADAAMIRAFSFGGGVQSTAALVLAAQGRIDYKTFLFANVGDDSENPDTLEYVRTVALSYAKQHGLELHEVARKTNDGETLYQRTLREKRSIKIPVRMKNGAPGVRSCTIDFKIRVIRQWLGKGEHIIGLGISLDEFHRMRASEHKRFLHEWPLVDLRLSRTDCLELIHDAGLPQPPKSACWFCPFHSMANWQTLRRDKPELFERAVSLERVLNEKRSALGKDLIWLTPKARPLSEVVADQPLLFEDEKPCDTNFCFT